MKIKDIFIILLSLSSASLCCNCNNSDGNSSHAPSIGGYNVYMGHIHNHTALSGGTGTPDKAYTYARYTAGMDFLGITEHGESLDNNKWNTLKTASEEFNDDSYFIALRGFEWTSSAYGHIAILETPGFCRSDSTATDTFTEISTWIHNNSGIAFFNHPGRENSYGTEFNHFTTTPVDNFAGMELWNKSRFLCN